MLGTARNQRHDIHASIQGPLEATRQGKRIYIVEDSSIWCLGFSRLIIFFDMNYFERLLPI